MDTIDSVAVADEPDRIAAGTWGEPLAYILLPLFLVVAFLMTFRSFGRLDTHIVGNSGDPLLILWILGWVQHAIPHGWDAVWNTSMFFPEPNTLAYSDSMLSVAIVEWPLRYVLGEALGLNVLTLAAQTASLWFMYQLTLRLTRSWPAAVVSALAFQFASPLISHVAHYQLTLTAFLVPLTLLVLVRYLETWAMRFGVGVGLSLAALTTSATYYGLMVASAIPVVVAGYFVWYRPKPIWTFLRGLVVGAGVAAAITLPVAVQYLDLQDDSYFRRSFDPVVAAHPSDFLSPDQDNYLLTELWPFEQHAFDRTLENRLFPGMVVTGFGIAGVVVLVRAIRRCRGENDEAGAGHEERAGPPSVDDCWRSRIGILIAGSGVVTLILSFGDEMSIGGADVPLPFKVLRDVVPGFSGIRATSRFVVMTVCALAVCAGFGVAAIMRRTSRRGSVVLLAVLCGLVIAETAIAIPLVRVPDGRVAESVADLLDDRPDGVVAELPIRGPLDGPLWAYLEAPRQLVSLDDTNDRVNGYSGYAPEGFDELVEELNTFPEPRALRALARHDVRYVVLRTRVLGEQEPGIAEALERDGVGRYTPASARDLIERLPEDRVRRVTRVPGAYVVELTRA